MSKARTLANLISDNAELADGQISVAEVVGAAPTANPSFTGNIDAGDNVKIRLGDSDDLQIYHTGGASVIQDSGDGSLFLQGESQIVLGSVGNAESYAVFNKDGAVQLRHDNAQKFSTTSTGIDVTGNVSISDYIVHSGDADTFFGFSNSNQIYFQAGNSRNLDLGSASTVFNQDSADIDFRVESNNNTHALFVDAGSSHVCLNTATDHGGVLNVETTGNAVNLVLVCTDTDGNEGPYLDLTRDAGNVPSDGDSMGLIRFRNDNTNLEMHNYATIETRTVDVSAGTEDGRLEITTIVAGTEGTSRALFNSGETVFNDNSADLDFRVESNNNSSMLFVDAGNDSVGIKQSNPSGYNAAARDLVVGDGSSTGGITIAGGTGSNGNIFFADGGGSDGYRGFVQYRHSVDDLILGAVTETMLNLASAEVVFNDDSYDRNFRVESDSDTHMLFVDASNNTLSVGTSSPPPSHTVNNPTMSIARAARIGEFVHGSVQNIYNSGNGRVFTVNSGNNGQAAMLQITAANHNGVIEQCFYLRNDAGTWVSVPGPVATSGTPPTITVVLNAGGTATFTVLGVGNNPNYYNQGYLIYKTSNAVKLTT